MEPLGSIENSAFAPIPASGLPDHGSKGRFKFQSRHAPAPFVRLPTFFARLMFMSPSTGFGRVSETSTGAPGEEGHDPLPFEDAQQPGRAQGLGEAFGAEPQLVRRVSPLS